MNLLKALATVSAMTFISRILGFVRDTVIARAFGAGLMTDAFFVAFKIPNLLRRLFAEGAFSQAFVPILGEYKAKRDFAEMRLLVDHVAGMLALALFVITLIGVIAAPVVIYLSAPGFSADAQKFDGFSLSIDAMDAADAKRMFDALAEGGQVRMPLGEAFFSPCFGMVADKFGVGWMIIV